MSQRSNTEYRIKIKAPLLRSGMELEVGPVSEKYVVQEAVKAFQAAKEINKQVNSD